MDQIINLIVTVTLFEMMVTIGLGVSFADVVGVARNFRLVARAALANYVIVPMVAIALLLSFHAHPMVAAGFIIAAVCPGAPYGPPFTAMAKGNVSVGLKVILAGSSVIINADASAGAAALRKRQRTAEGQCGQAGQHLNRQPVVALVPRALPAGPQTGAGGGAQKPPQSLKLAA